VGGREREREGERERNCRRDLDKTALVYDHVVGDKKKREIGQIRAKIIVQGTMYSK
jgi:hypothetical protein